MKEHRKFEVIESRQMDHLRVFHDVARTLTTSLDLQEILSAIMDKMASFFGPERWSLLMVDEKLGDLYFAIAVGETAASLKNLPRVEMGKGVAGWVAATGNPLIVPDVSLDPQWAAFARQNPDLKIQSIACVPIRQGSKTLGVIQLHNSKLDLLSEYSISFLRILCDYAAIAIQNSRSMTLIQELTITDDCTSLYNARHLYTQLEQLVNVPSASRVKGQRGVFSLVFMDMDRFKTVNDTHGHLIGSRLLAEVGDLLRRKIGPGCSAFRYGGDEFVLLLPGFDKIAATDLTIDICLTLRKLSFLNGANLQLKVAGSFGVATFPEDGDTVHSIMKAADTMMYEVKNSTRNNVAVHGIGVLKTLPPPPRRGDDSGIHMIAG
ncbi:diguanylate cyclase with GAF sensor [Granulicella rosea]|uniref:Diguanylate cyclase with GAF sensor n=1 Tax=Granulicella rosea TaxID=474952 RepID=A0A239LHK3_9BACT|nr:sensor domain-containing diguanylate cyclase [Granulicella rosea]SNT29770.1 diguanylate cyclase with GAF sensor [Granulicella rosea]